MRRGGWPVVLWGWRVLGASYDGSDDGEASDARVRKKLVV